MLHTDLIAPIPELLRRHAAARGDKIAYRDAQTSVTYASLLCKRPRPIENIDRDRSRRMRREGAPLRDAGDDAAEIRAARSRVAARDLVHPLHLGHHRPRQGRAAHGARHVVDHRRLLGADTRLSSATPCSRRSLFHSYALNL